MDEAKLSTVVYPALTSSMTDYDLEHTQFLNFPNYENMNDKENDTKTPESFEENNYHAQIINDGVDQQCDPIDPNGESDTSRRYPERAIVAPKRVAYAARNVSERMRPF